MPKIRLNNGIEIPVIGIGPGIMKIPPYTLSNSKNWFVKYIDCKINQLRTKFYLEQFAEIIAHAISIGFTLLDYSAAYGNEKYIGKAIAQSGASRRDLVLTSRVSNSQQRLGHIHEQLLRTLDYYGTDYIDIFMFHWPVPKLYLKTWEQMIRLQQDGLVKTLGVANCHQHHLDYLMKESGFIPSINQFEVHPLFTQKPLIEYCNSKGIVVEAYTPIARFDDRLVRLPLLHNICRKYSKSVAQVVLRWHMQNGIIPVVRSHNKDHQLENISIFDFELTTSEIAAIDGININSRLRFDPDNCDFSIL